MAVKTENNKIGDLIKREWDADYTRDEVTIKNPFGNTVTLTNPVGYPLRKVGTQYQLLQAGEEAQVEALLLEETDLDAILTTATTTRKYLILERGPVVIDYSILPIADFATSPGTIVVADLAEALINMGIVVRKEPVKISTQSM